jgi:phospholipase C
MQSFDAGALPSIGALADHFVLCDAWFCEVPASTHPNRLYMHAGTSAGFVHNVFDRDFDLITIYELLERANRTWAVYDFDMNEARHFRRIAARTDNFREFSPAFAQDVETGKLPDYSFVMPRYSATHRADASSQHAPHDVRWGDHLIADIYDTLRANAQVWNRCAFIVTYDEHGGFFDHVAPPAAVSPDGIASPRADDKFHGGTPPAFAFDRLGLRVPALIVSPWVGKGVVAHKQYQHTSVLRTVRQRFGIKQALSKREAAAASLAPLFNQKKARTDTPEKLPRAVLPELPAADHHANPGNQPLDDLQRDMFAGAMHATRLSLPLGEAAAATTPPRTQAELSLLVRQRWAQQSKWLKR